MSETKKFECNSCSFKFRVEPRKLRSPWCPNCRSTVHEADYPDPEKEISYQCGGCGAVFHTPENQMYPYKCPFCNFTIPKTP